MKENKYLSQIESLRERQRLFKESLKEKKKRAMRDGGVSIYSCPFKKVITRRGRRERNGEKQCP